MPDPLDPPHEIRTFPSAHIGRRALLYESLPSTNDLAARLAADPEHHGTVVVAGHQTAGRGQYGRVWHSRPGDSVLMSVALSPPAVFRRPVVLTAWAAVAIGDAVRFLTGVQTRIKWPNDLLVRGKKVCGILTETAVSGSSFRSVVGIGLNLNQPADDFVAAGLPDATSLALVARTRFEPGAVLEAVVGQLDAKYARVVGGELVPLEADWKWGIGLLGRPVAVELAGDSTVTGRLRNIAFDGIEVNTDAGEVRVLPPESVRHITPLAGSNG